MLTERQGAVRRIGLVCLVLAVVASSSWAKTKPTTAVGKYEDWGHMDRIEVVSAFKLSDYDRIALDPLDTSAAPIPDKDDNTYEAVQETLKGATTTFLEAFREEVQDFRKMPVELHDGKAGPSGDAASRTLVVRCKIVVLDPGSKAARLTVGFGAGAARTGIEGEVQAGDTQTVLLRFTQERRSGVGMLGGGYQKLMRKNLREIAEDLAKVLKEF